jgi:serpin B
VDFQVIVPASVQASVPFSVLVEAETASNHVATGYTGRVQISLGTADAGALLPADYTFVPSDHGEHRFQVTLSALGSQTIVATDTKTSSITGSAVTNVNPAPAAAKLLVITPSNALIGVPVNVTVEALDVSGHVVTNYTGTLSLTTTVEPFGPLDGVSLLTTLDATLPASYTFTASDNGKHTFQVTCQGSGTGNLTATGVTPNATITGQASLVVHSAPADKVTHFSISIENQAYDILNTRVYPSGELVSSLTFGITKGAPTAVVVSALDAQNHVVTGYTGTIEFSSSDGSAKLPAEYTFHASDDGAHQFHVTFNTVSTQATLTATDASSHSLTGTGPISVYTPIGPVTHFAIFVEGQYANYNYPIATPTNALPINLGVSAPTAGVPTTVTVDALDANGYIVTGYVGTVHFTSNDGSATLPADYKFVANDGGSHSFSVTFNTPGSQTLTATDTKKGAITSSDTLTVAPPFGLATHFGISYVASPSGQIQIPWQPVVGVATWVTVTALDADNRVVQDYSGTIHFTSPDPSAEQTGIYLSYFAPELPADYTFQASDVGSHSFMVTFNSAGQQSLTVTDAANGTIVGSFGVYVWDNGPLNTPITQVPPTTPTQTTPAEGQAATAIDTLATDLYSKLSSQQGNLAYSPFSIETALAMAYAGASGKTATEMAKVLHLGPDTPATHAALAALIQQVVTDGNATGSTLNTANSLFGQSNYPFNPAFLQLLQNTYDAPLQNVDFMDESEQARATINNWVAQETQNKIPNLFPDGTINAQTRLVLANAIYFHGSWVNAFDPNATNTGSFAVTPSKTVQVSLMHQTSNFLYGDKNGVQTLEMPYVGGNLAMDILLPDQPNGIGTLSSQLTAANLAQWTSGLSNDSVDVTLPKFQVNTSFSLNSVLGALGMPDAFNPKTADFSGMTTGSNRLYISQVVHQAYVNVDETGTEAAAATGVGMSPGEVNEYTPPPVVFDADHPFVYVIRDTSTNTILFMGRVSDPSQS